MKSVVLLILVLSISKAFGQNANDSIQIIETLIRSKNDLSILLYADRIDNYYIERFEKALTKNKIYGYSPVTRKKAFIMLDEEERINILSQVEKFRFPYWKDSLFRNSKVISEDTLMKLFNDTSGIGRKFLWSKYGTRHTQFTNPIFFHNNQMFIIQFLKMVGSECGTDVLAIYKKEEIQWKMGLWIEGGYY